MERRERLLEDVQDSVFFLLLDELSEHQGKAYQKLNRDLQSEPDTTVPSEVTTACRQTIRKAFQMLNRKHRGTKATAILKKTVIAVAIMVTLITGALAALPVFRDSTLNWVAEIVDDGTLFQFRNSYTNTDWDFTWLPLGYTCTEDEEGVLTFEDSEGNFLHITIMPRDGSRTLIDTEDADVIKDLEIREFPTKLVVKDNWVTIVWNYLETDYYFVIAGGNLTSSEICQIADGIYPAQK